MEGRCRDPAVSIVVTLGERVIGALAGDPQVDAGAEQFGPGPDHLGRAEVVRDTLHPLWPPPPPPDAELDLGDGLERDEESAPGE